jgi:hypothetical protein
MYTSEGARPPGLGEPLLVSRSAPGFGQDPRSSVCSAPNSALDRSVRTVTPVAGGHRARQSVPPVSASVRRNPKSLFLILTLYSLGWACVYGRTTHVIMDDLAGRVPLLRGTVTLERLALLDPGPASQELWPHLVAPLPRFEYPVVAIKAHVQGMVELEGVMAPDGSVEDAIVLRGLPSGINEAALRGVFALRFRRCSAGGPLPPRRFRATLRFGLS